VSAETLNFNNLSEIHKKGMPIVFFDRIVDEIETHKVIVDNFTGAYNATKHLIEMGYRNIAHLCNASILSIAKERLAGYLTALKDHGMMEDKTMIKYCKHGGMIAEEIEEALRQLWKNKRKPDAIFASSDKLTIGCLRILKKKNISFPKDMGLIGFSNGDLTDLLDPPLSVVRQPAFEMGQLATQMLLQLIESKYPITNYETKVLSTELIIRNSTKIQVERS
jgi:LacI family transcriptional regulator